VELVLGDGGLGGEGKWEEGAEAVVPGVVFDGEFEVDAGDALVQGDFHDRDDDRVALLAAGRALLVQSAGNFEGRGKHERLVGLAVVRAHDGPSADETVREDVGVVLIAAVAFGDEGSGSRFRRRGAGRDEACRR
jgi:hypothetical protein